jgi:ATP-dependent exoDNAse (exonuclease V) beta subunit|nr:MAG TPA: Exonuclease V [Caudoviricetes sp.]
MPKLKNVKEKYVNGLKVDKETKDVVYSDEAHVYIDKIDQQKYVSVTTLIGKYENPFDVFFWSSYKTCEKLMSEETFHVLKETLLATKRWTDDMIEKLHLDPIIFDKTRKEIQKGYDDERNKSCERGTKIHSNFEEMYYTSEKQDLKKFGLGGVFTCKKGYYELDLEKGVYPEFLVSLKSSDGILRVAGQIDLLIKDGNDIIIADYKTNKEIKKHSYFDKNKFSRIMMKYPLNNIEDCNFYHYSLQLSTYAYLLQQIKPELNIKKLMLIHIDHDDKITEYTVDYLKNDVERMLKHYKKLLKQTTVLDRDRPIVF